MTYMTQTQQQNFRVSGLFRDFFRAMAEEVTGKPPSQHGAGKDFSETAVVALHALGPDVLKLARELKTRFERDPNGAARELLSQIARLLEERAEALKDAGVPTGRQTPKGASGQQGRRRGNGR
jgi:hypothetical protein